MVTRSRALSLLGGSAAAGILRAPAFAQSAKIRVGTQATEVYAEPIFGVEGAIFKKAGLDVEVVLFNNAAQSLAALMGGSIDIAGNDAIELANGVTRGLPLVFIAGGGLYRSVSPTILFCVDKNSPVRQAQDLEDRTIAVVTLGGLMYTVTKAWLARSGANIDKIRIIEIPAPELAVSLQRGIIAGATIPEPALTAARPTVRVLGKPYDSVADVFQISSWLTTRDWLSHNPQVARQFVDGMYATARWSNDHQDETLAILERYAKLNPDAVRGMTRAQFSTRLPQAQLQPLLDTGLKWGAVKSPVDISKYIAFNS
jgi:ABC-type nitrate/sulfonate/bicarbonate transport system substrate-binding protein